MQLPATDELVLVSGCPPIRAKKVRYYEDQRLKDRILPPLKPTTAEPTGKSRADDWSGSAVPANCEDATSERRPSGAAVDDPANGGIRREPELPEHEDIAPDPAKPSAEFAFGEDEPDDDAIRARVLRAKARGLARQAAMDPGDGLDL
jgi:type IV secretion system protein VirD4